MPDHRQKKLAKQKKKRARAGRAGMRSTGALEEQKAMRALAAHLPMMPKGDCYITRGWNEPSQPRLQCLVVTRRANESTVVPVVLLVDLGCQGLRDGYPTPPTGDEGVSDLLEMLAQLFPQGFEQVSPERASAIVHQAIAYAAKIGIEVPPGVRPMLAALAEQQETGFEVELGRAGKPLYEPQPDEDYRPMVKRLVEAVGPDGFQVVLPPKDDEGATES